MNSFDVGTLLDGEPIINLPPKTVNLSKVEFSSEERAFYSKLESDSRSKFKVLIMLIVFFQFGCFGELLNTRLSVVSTTCLGICKH